MLQYKAITMDSKIEKPFTLTMLGTLTEFTPELKQTAKATPYTQGDKVADYPKGETLSIVSFLIKTASPAKIIKNVQIVKEGKDNYPYQADEIAVVNGPVTHGGDVGEKIALGLAATLKAIARGQNVVNIIAHSRGAVEAILIAHELESIQSFIGTCLNIENILERLMKQQTKRHKGPPSNNTPDIIEPLKSLLNLPKEEQRQLLNGLRDYLPEASINFFGIDPVPGDCPPITWYDERYFVLPTIIKKAELIYYANERSSWGFTPIYPEAVSKTEQNLVYYSMPGHHGTGSSGNNGSQRGTIISSKNHKTTHVQKLLIFKLLRFLNGQHVEFNDASQIFHKYAGLGRKYIGNYEEAKTIPVQALDFPTILRALYAVIVKNPEGYNAYNFTHYPYMGLTEQRKILHKKHVYGLFNVIFTPYAGYVNEEHALLMQTHFFEIFGLNAPIKNLAEMLNDTRLVLEENINKIGTAQETVLNYPDRRKSVLETFGIMIGHASQYYLTSDWSEKQKKNLQQAIIDIISTFKELSESGNSTIKNFATKLYSLSFTSISNVLVLQSTKIEEDFNYLHESIENRLRHFFRTLMQLNGIENSYVVILEEIINSEEYKKLPNHPPGIKTAHVYKNLPVNGLEKYKYSIEQLTKSYEEQYSDTIKDFAKLYQQILLLIYYAVIFRKIFPDQALEINELRLNNYANELIAIAAERFYKGIPQALSPSTEKDLFIRLTEKYALKFFALDEQQKEKNKSQEIKPMVNRSQSGSSKSFFSFWSPLSAMIYGSKASTSTDQEIPLKDMSINKSSS